MHTMLAIAIVLIPLVLAVIAARRYNIIFGLFTYLFFAILLVLGAEKFPKLGKLMIVGTIDYNSFHKAMVGFLFRNSFDKIGFIKRLSWKPYLEVGVFAVIFLIFWIVSIKIRHSRKRRMFNKYANVRIVQPRY